MKTEKDRIFVPQQTIKRGSGEIYFGQKWDESDIEYVRADLLAAARETAFKEAMKIVDEAGEEWGVQARDRKSKTYSAYVLAALDLKGRIEAALTEK